MCIYIYLIEYVVTSICDPMSNHGLFFLSPNISDFSNHWPYTVYQSENLKRLLGLLALDLTPHIKIKLRFFMHLDTCHAGLVYIGSGPEESNVV